MLRVRKVSSQPGRPQTALTAPGSQATFTANPRHRPKHRAPAPANSIPRTLASYGVHAVSLARLTAISRFDVFAHFMRFFRNVRGTAHRWGGAVASTPRIHDVRFEHDRAHDGGFSGAHPRQHMEYGGRRRHWTTRPRHADARSRARRVVRPTYPQDRPRRGHTSDIHMHTYRATRRVHTLIAAAHIAGSSHG